MTYRILYHPRVQGEDLPLLNRDLRDRIARVIEQRLTTEPTYYGESLRHHLKGYWKLRVGDYRIVYTLIEQTVLVIAVRHRKNVYAISVRRLIWRP